MLANIVPLSEPTVVGAEWHFVLWCSTKGCTSVTRRAETIHDLVTKLNRIKSLTYRELIQ